MNRREINRNMNRREINRKMNKNKSIEMNRREKPNKIIKWIKSNGVDDFEMLKTFNCGIGFCIITDKKNLKKIQKVFSEYKG